MESSYPLSTPVIALVPPGPVYQNSVSRLENFDIMQTGGIKRRGGTERIGKLKGYARLIPFIVNNTLSFIFEIGPEYIRIWKNGTLLKITVKAFR